MVVVRVHGKTLQELSICEDARFAEVVNDLVSHQVESCKGGRSRQKVSRDSFHDCVKATLQARIRGDVPDEFAALIIVGAEQRLPPVNGLDLAQTRCVGSPTDGGEIANSVMDLFGDFQGVWMDLENCTAG